MGIWEVLTKVQVRRQGGEKSSHQIGSQEQCGRKMQREKGVRTSFSMERMGKTKQKH
jgi:hypothetical protein